MISFSPDQEERLRACGVTDAQLRRLHRVLPTCRAIRTSPPGLTDVRAELLAAQAKVDDARRSVERLRRGASLSRAVGEANARIMLAGPEDALDHLGDSAGALETLAASIASALAQLPEDQRRLKADSEPIRLIHRALWDGWADDNMPVGDSDAAGMLPGVQRDQVPGPVTRTDGSAFLEIASVCLEAAGGSSGNPDRAIRRYLEEEQERRRTGREVGRNSDLPS